MAEPQPITAPMDPRENDNLDRNETIAEKDNKKRGLSTKKCRVIGRPRFPSAHRLQYDTNHYVLYDPQTQNTGPAIPEKFRSFAQFDQCTLYINPNVEEAGTIPSSGVRLDDMTVASVLTKCDQKTLHANWPAKFDTAGMNEGDVDVDVDGNIVPEGGAGYYYKWWRGLHCLCGKEGLDNKMYKIRPSFETFGCQGFGFKVSSRAIIQFPSGDLAGPTFATSMASTTSTAFTTSTASTAS